MLRVYRAKVVHGTYRDQVSVYKVSQDQHLPGILMSPMALCTKELANETRCSAVELEFHSRQGNNSRRCVLLRPISLTPRSMAVAKYQMR